MTLDAVAHTNAQPRATNVLGQGRPKVSIIASDLSKSGAGRWQGAVRPFLLAETVRRLGYDTEILGFADGFEPAHFATDVEIKAWPGGTYPRFFSAARDLIQAVSGDIVYAYKPKPSSFGLALLHRLRHRRPVVLDIDDWELSWHGGDSARPAWSPHRLARGLLKTDGELRQPDHPLYLRWMERLISQADAVTLHTQFLQQRFGGTYIPNGKDIELFDPSRHSDVASRQHHGLSDYRVIMFPGAPRPYKGVEDLLAALEQLNQADLRVVIVGGSPYDDYDKTLAERWGRWLIQLPKCPYPQMPELVAAAHVVAVPQRNHPAAQAQFPLKLTDGMAMAKPILATTVGDIPHIVGETGYLVEPDSPAQLAEAIERIFSQPQEARLKGQQARARCIEQYSLEAMAPRLEQVLTPLLASRR